MGLSCLPVLTKAAALGVKGGFEKDQMVWSPLAPEGHWFITHCWCLSGWQHPGTSHLEEGHPWRCPPWEWIGGAGGHSGPWGCFLVLRGFHADQGLLEPLSALPSTSVQVGGMAFLMPVCLCKSVVLSIPRQMRGLLCLSGLAEIGGCKTRRWGDGSRDLPSPS